VAAGGSPVVRCGSLRMADDGDSISVRWRMSSKLLRLAAVVGALVVVSVLASGSGAVGARSISPTVHFRGTAYEFNNGKILLNGATIRVVEFPKLKATVQRDGRYDLMVPDHAKVTPYIVDPGYHTIYLQTFTTNGEDLANVNFQTPTDAVYRGLVALLKVPVDSHGNLVACAIASTFSTRNVRDLSYAQFAAYGAHGVPGATATAIPLLPEPGVLQQGRRARPRSNRLLHGRGHGVDQRTSRRLHDHRA
jgi:hypothetical protein